jgi:threonine/homoserine/homoserine lactone efflux protein
LGAAAELIVGGVFLIWLAYEIKAKLEMTAERAKHAQYRRNT